MRQTMPARALVRICTLPSILLSGVADRRGVQPSRRNTGLIARRGHWLRIRPSVQHSPISVGRNRGRKAKETHSGLKVRKGFTPRQALTFKLRLFQWEGGDTP